MKSPIVKIRKRRRWVVAIFLGASVACLILVFGGQAEEWATTTISDFQGSFWMYSILSFFLLLSDILLPIPSSLVMYMNGAVLGLVSGTLLSLLASQAGGMLGYLIGRKSGDFFRKKGPALRTQQFLNRYGGLGIVISRAVPILSEMVSFTCGYQGYSSRVFFLWNALGYLPVCTFYATLGHWGMERDQFLLSVGVSVFASFLFWLAYRLLGQTPPAGMELSESNESQ
jgi:uncharacterized membrane protein YdjX (TVP38/TMEM64 family)